MTPARSVRTTAPIPRAAGRIGWIVAGSLATGLVAALLLVAAPFIQVQENDITGAVLWGFALGWAMLAVLSMRFTDQPQRWAVVPAVFMGVSGLLLVAFGSGVNDALRWVWPPALLALAVWMAVQAHRHLRSRTRRWLLYPVIAVMALASVGGGYETVREHLDASAYPMPGQLIDVGGHRLHLHCTGSGSPTVVLQPGGGDMSSAMGWIAPAVAAHTRVCVYDRAGRGWSDPSDTTQDGAQIATDLHTLLHRAHVPGPYVLAGHSFGGLYVRIFAARYPDEVAGHGADRLDRSRVAGIDLGSEAGVPTTSWLVPPCWHRPRLGWVWGAWSALGYGSLPPQSADEVARQARHLNQSSQHHRRVPPSQRVGTRGCISHRLRRQAAVRPDSRQRERRRLDGGAGQDGHLVDQQRAPRRRGSHPRRPDPGRGRRRRHRPGHHRRRLIGPEQPAAGQVIGETLRPWRPV